MKLFISILFTLILTFQLKSQTKTIEVNCNPETGLCEMPDIKEDTSAVNEWKTDEEIIYVGDPMCSWCWGISPQLNALQRYCEQEGIPFTVIMGGLRPGGGEEWNDEFKGFLKHHWQEVNKRSNQPFGYDLFELESFNYDTEPSCRAVVTVRTIAPEKALVFYELVQHFFYVKNNDPKQLSFYLPICKELSIDFKEFSKQFSSQEMITATQQDFAQSRQMGVSGFPAVIYRKKDKLYALSRGYSTFEIMKTSLMKLQLEE